MAIRRVPLLPWALLIAIGLVVWNASRFNGARPQIRTKDLTFLPGPELGLALSCGQRSSVAMLRWIDSFAYFQLQLERKDDAVLGGGTAGGFQRLYDLLIGLDPRFEPFYHHAALTTGGVVGHDHVALGMLMRGTEAMPECSAIWRHAASVLVTSFDFEVRQPRQMQAFLAAWAEAERSPQGKQQVWQWQAALAKRRLSGLEQLPYWLDQLAGLPPGTPMAEFVERVICEQLTRFALGELQALRALHRELRGAEPTRPEDLAAPELLQRRYGGRLPIWGPIAPDLSLRGDPYGFAWRLGEDGPRSVGAERGAHWKQLAMLNVKLAAAERSLGRRLQRLDEIGAFGLALPPPPEGGRHRAVDGRVAVDYVDGEPRPWDLRAMLRGKL